MAEGLVLIVEDHEVNLKLARAVLERAGYQTIEAQSADEALERLQMAHPDLILMDIQLPGRDGLDLTRQLKADPLTADIPILAVTAHAMSEDRGRALAAGCDGYISKPINTHALTSEIVAAMQKRKTDKGQGEV